MQKMRVFLGQPKVLLALMKRSSCVLSSSAGGYVLSCLLTLGAVSRTRK